MTYIEIHGVGENGVSYVLNHFSSDNAEMNDKTRPNIMRRFNNILGAWKALFPYDEIFLVEIDSETTKVTKI
jgi:hypothetical protein